MRVLGLSWTVFRLPLRAPFRTAAGEITRREGLILRLVTDGGIVGLGEASPHPALGSAAVWEVREALARIAPSLLGVELTSLERLGPGLPPALACAIDVAACDALARQRRVSVARLLGGRVRASVPVNATIGATSAAEARAAAAQAAGFRSVKLKVGASGDMEEQRQTVAALRQALRPGTKLRIDANGAWDPTQALYILLALEPYDLEMVEQPLAAGDLEGLARLRAMVRVPIAVDEAVTGLGEAQRVLEAGAADVLVVKPMVVGGLRPARRIAEMAAAAGVSIVVTTTIDAGVGTAAALHLAATLPAGSPACGLAIVSRLADDLIVEPLATHRGRMKLPQGVGLGVDLDEAALARYACASGEAP